MPRIVITCIVTTEKDEVKTEIDVGRHVPNCKDLAGAIAEAVAAGDGEVTGFIPKPEPPEPIVQRVKNSSFAVAPVKEVAGEEQKEVVRQEPTG